MYVEWSVRLTIIAEEGIELSEIISEMDYNFISKTKDADIYSTEFLGYELTDSK